jgi:hypothetical protein
MSLSKKLQDAATAATLAERHRILKICQGMIDEVQAMPANPAEETARRQDAIVQTLKLVVKNVKSGFVATEIQHPNNDPFAGSLPM